MGRKRKTDKVPSYDKMIIPTVEALKQLGGSGSIEEINEKVYKIADYSEEILEISHDESGVQTQVEYRLAWARTYLKKYGILENSSRGVWSLIDNEIDISKLNADEIVRFVRGKTRKAKPDKDHKTKDPKDEIEEDVDDETDWKQNLISILLKIEPSAFERLCQRLLRESGFIQVEVTGKTGDGGDRRERDCENKWLSKFPYFLSM